MTSTYQRPRQIPLEARRPKFDLQGIPKHWADGDPIKTHFLNAFSVPLPAIESFFIGTIQKRKSELTDLTLQKDAQTFCSQEGAHAAEHRKYNQMLMDQGYPGIRKAEKILVKTIGFARKYLSEGILLSITAGAEHITSSMGHQYLAYPERWARNSHPSMDALWKWHALEEVEHKAVCYDVFQSLYGSRGLRILGFLVNIPLLGLVFGTMFYLLHKDGLLGKLTTWRQLFQFLFGSEGFLRQMVRESLVYTRRDFHPWQVDDSHLVQWALQETS